MYQRKIQLPEEDLRDDQKEDGATKSLIKRCGIASKEEEEEDGRLRHSTWYKIYSNIRTIKINNNNNNNNNNNKL